MSVVLAELTRSCAYVRPGASHSRKLCVQRGKHTPNSEQRPKGGREGNGKMHEQGKEGLCSLEEKRFEKKPCHLHDPCQLRSPTEGQRFLLLLFPCPPGRTLSTALLSKVLF